MSSTDPAPPPPTLRIDIKRTLTGGTLAYSALPAGSPVAIATIRFENATFQPNGGFQFAGNRWTSISFPDASTLQISVRPASQRLVQGNPAAVFAASLSTVTKLGVLLSEPAAALVGEISHNQHLGNLVLGVSDSADSCTLPAAIASRPFALKAPVR